MPDQLSLSNHHPPLRVLIADDVAEVRHELRVLLELTGEFQIVGGASNGLEAVRQAETLQPDVILMDLEMPIMDGYQSAYEIITRRPGCRVIALTIHDGEAERQHALQVGMADVIVKGAPLELLLQAIRSATTDEDKPTRDSA